MRELRCNPIGITAYTRMVMTIREKFAGPKFLVSKYKDTSMALFFYRKYSMTQKYDRFNLEAEIMSVWNTKDDLESITSRMMDDPDPMSEDDIANVLIGVSELHDIRCKKLFNVFETMVKERRFTGMGEMTPGLGI